VDFPQQRFRADPRDQTFHTIVADARGNAVATLGTDPIDIAESDWVVHPQRQDGAIIRVQAVKFSSRDLDFLSEGE
jgi:hypothetical protein